MWWGFKTEVCLWDVAPCVMGFGHHVSDRHCKGWDFFLFLTFTIENWQKKKKFSDIGRRMSTKCKTQNNQILQIYCFFYLLLEIFLFHQQLSWTFSCCRVSCCSVDSDAKAGMCSASAALLTLLLSGRRNLVWGKKGKKLLFFVLREIMKTENAASFEYSDA